METVYLETTFISYLVALPARDLVIAAHQQVTRDWWQHRRQHFRCVVSPGVIDEVSMGDKSEIKKRLGLVRPLEVLAASTDAEELTQAIMDAGVLPEKAVRDAAHIAVAAVHGVEYLLTWNCKHLANAQISRRVQVVCNAQGFRMPLICTPEELLEENTDE
ncbi:MAG: type II toxin-antitoxin system VapC family toxin [Planctomycetota bacterium]|nr:type II toxin-antitoxin system VapC family toxin [Planctomycetota bacterium]